jgi:putative DNA primase/helicase
MSAFVRECCVKGPDQSVVVDTLYERYRDWCNDDGLRPLPKQLFGRDLRAVLPRLRIEKPHGQKRQYVGIGLKLRPTEHSYERRNAQQSGSYGSNGSEPGEPREPHGNALQPLYETDEDLPFIEHCNDCGERLDEPGYLARCRPSHKITTP